MSLARLFSALLLGVSLSTTQPIWAGEDKLKLPEAQVKALGIETLVIGQGDAAARRYPAQVQVPAAQMRAIASPVEGLIERVWVAPGSVVKKGQPLISIASPQALTMQREAVQANSQWTLMQQNLKRDELLFAEGLIAEARLQATRAAAQQAKAEAEERRESNMAAYRAWRDGEGKRRYFARLVVNIAPDLREKLPVDIGFFVAFGVCQFFFVDLPKKHLRKAFIDLLHGVIQTQARHGCFRWRTECR